MAKAGIGFTDLKDVFSLPTDQGYIGTACHATGWSFKRKAIPTCNK